MHRYGKPEEIAETVAFLPLPTVRSVHWRSDHHRRRHRGGLIASRVQGPSSKQSLSVRAGPGQVPWCQRLDTRRGAAGWSVFEQIESPGKGNPGAADVKGKNRFGFGCVRSGDRVDEQPMLGIDNPPALRTGDSHVSAAVGLRGIPEPINDPFQLRVLASVVGEVVQFAVEREESFRIVVAFDLTLDLLEPGDVIAGKVGDALRKSKRFKAFADFVHRLAAGQVELGHPGTAVGLECDQSLVLQDSQRLAHRNAACAELVGDVLLPDPLTGLQLPGKNLLS